MKPDREKQESLAIRGNELLVDGFALWCQMAKCMSWHLNDWGHFSRLHFPHPPRGKDELFLHDLHVFVPEARWTFCGVSIAPCKKYFIYFLLYLFGSPGLLKWNSNQILASWLGVGYTTHWLSVVTTYMLWGRGGGENWTVLQSLLVRTWRCWSARLQPAWTPPRPQHSETLLSVSPHLHHPPSSLHPPPTNLQQETSNTLQSSQE